MMYQRKIAAPCCLAAVAALVLTSGIASRAQQKSQKELIAGNWTLVIADNTRSEGSNVPGFGPLPKGTARFGTDGRYSLEIKPTTGNEPGLSASGTYTLDEVGKALKFKVEESSIPTWKG